MKTILHLLCLLASVNCLAVTATIQVINNNATAHAWRLYKDNVVYIGGTANANSTNNSVSTTTNYASGFFDGVLQVKYTPVGGPDYSVVATPAQRGPYPRTSDFTAVFYITPGSTETNCSYTLCIRNTDIVPHSYSVYQNGVPLEPPASGNILMILRGGAYGCVTWQGPCGESGFALGLSPDELDYYPQVTMATNFTQFYGEGAYYPNATNTPLLNYGLSNSIPTNIIWTAQQQTNAIQSQQAGDMSTRDELQKLRAEVAKGSANIVDAIGGISTGGGSTNSDAAAIQAFHTDATNLLSEINNSLQYTNNLAASSTNASDATSAANSIISDMQSEGDAAIAELGSAPTGFLSGGSPEVFTMDFMGTELNLDPAVRFPGSGEFSKALISFLALLGLGRYLADLYLKASIAYSGAETGGIPAVGPWGSAGVAISFISAAAIVTLWIVVFTAIFGYAAAQFTEIASSAAGVSLSNNGTLYLINYFIPVSLLLSCAWTRIIAPFAVAKVVVAAASASRFIMAK